MERQSTFYSFTKTTSHREKSVLVCVEICTKRPTLNDSALKHNMTQTHKNREITDC